MDQEEDQLFNVDFAAVAERGREMRRGGARSRGGARRRGGLKTRGGASSRAIPALVEDSDDDDFEETNGGKKCFHAFL